MEEKVGELWHKLIMRMADQRYLNAAVYLNDEKNIIGTFFRALGGDGALQVEAVDSTAINRRRNWLQRIAGTGNRVELAWRDQNALKLPAQIAWFDSKELNRKLYFWLAAMAANEVQIAQPKHNHWFARSQLSVLVTLQRYPGLINNYAALVQAHLQQRPDPQKLSAREKLAELEIRQALIDPGSVKQLTMDKRSPFPVPLWLHPETFVNADFQQVLSDEENNNSGQQETRELEDLGRRKAERVKPPEEGKGLITIRMENIFSWGEFINLDRGNEDEEDADQAESVARDLDVISVSRNRRSSAIRLKFDLDLPSASSDDEVLSDGLLLPEWDWKKGVMIENCCHVIEMMATDAEPLALPEHLTKTARKLRNQFQMLAPARVWHRNQADGQDIDIDAYLRYAAEKSAAEGVSADGLYRELRSGARDLACLLVADLSLSTDSWVNDQQRVIDVIRDSLFLFAESLNATGDLFSMIGFSSRKRDPIRVHLLKTFDEKYSAEVRGRINAIKPGYYTRLGAAIRYATEQLKLQGASRRLMLILTDGKPNDLDQYEGRFGIEDTRQAILSAKKLGLQPFCVTIDEKGNRYLPHLFGVDGYAVIHNPLQMPQLLPRLYARLTS
ncbi:MAG: VWA domain-containing protein [Gammaproteobacteria bacterium]|nr:VWA domain-containing protein [Gammaproteobacteria bacterium]MBL6999299.1 VWA domain-containing protein [Gammaproteobacteria bacterium]